MKWPLYMLLVSSEGHLQFIKAVHWPVPAPAVLAGAWLFMIEIFTHGTQTLPKMKLHFSVFHAVDNKCGHYIISWWYSRVQHTWVRDRVPFLTHFIPWAITGVIMGPIWKLQTPFIECCLMAWKRLKVLFSLQ